MPTPKEEAAAGNGNAVHALLEGLEHPHKAGILELREWILKLDPRITEEVKWNAPSFKLEDHFATFRLHPPKGIQLILHTGAKAKSNSRHFVVADPEGLLAWPATDRSVLTIASAEELCVYKAQVQGILKQWVAQL